MQSSRPWEPHDYQKRAVKFLIERAEAGLFLDPGLGKTSSTLGAFTILKKKKMVRRALILAPLRVAQAVWPEEIKKWKDFEHLRVVVLHGPDKDKLAQQDADIYVINYEGLDWLMGAHVVMKKAWKVIDGKRQQVEVPETKYSLKNFNLIGADVLVADECFPAGALVRTPAGDVAIETLREGDLVTTSFGPAPVKSVIRKASDDLVKLTDSRGGELTCTANHPIFTDLGWVEARDCLGRIVYGEDDLQSMRDGNVGEARRGRALLRLLQVEVVAQEPPGAHGEIEGVRCEAVGGVRKDQTTGAVQVLRGDLRSGSVEGSGARGLGVLQQVVLQAANVEGPASDAHGGSEKDEGYHGGEACMEQGGTLGGGYEGEAARNLEKRPREASGIRGGAWRQWEDIADGDAGTGNPIREVHLELRGADQGEVGVGVPDVLQTGLRGPGGEAGHRGGRREPQLVDPKIPGSEEGRLAVGARVESIASVECKGPVPVWNLEIDGTPHFFANGRLVHNCTRLKHAQTATFKALQKGLGKFARRWILTGTPAPNGLLDLFGQAYVMDQGKSLGQFITHYKSRYFMQVGFGGFKWEPMPGSQEKIYEALAPYILRLDADDYLKLPEFIEHDIMIDLPPKARKFYDELETEFLALTDGGELFTAPSVGAALAKCAQVASGALYKTPIVDDDSGIPMDAREWIVLHDEKIEALRDLVEELQGQPLLVAYNFKHDLFRLRKAFGKSAVCFDDYRTEKEVVALVRRWNAGEIPLLLGHPASMGHGLNMQESSAHVAWFSGTFNREHYDQFNKRVLRQGNTNSHVTAHRFIARHTVEEVMRLALRVKGKNQTALLDALKEYRQNR